MILISIYVPLIVKPTLLKKFRAWLQVISGIGFIVFSDVIPFDLSEAVKVIGIVLLATSGTKHEELFSSISRKYV